jgi:hypothetical protein
MSKKLVDGVWVIVCDWVDPTTNKTCDLGAEGDPKMTVDPDGGKDPSAHYQCGIHHGVVKQEDRPEFQVPKGHKLNEEVLKRGRYGDEITVEEIEDD